DLMHQVDLVLQDIGAAQIPRLEIFNKIDLLENVVPHIDRDEEGNAIRIWLSAVTGQGIELLFDVLVEKFANTKVRRRCFLTPQQGGIRANLFAHAQILDEIIDEFGDTELFIEIDVKHLGLLKDIQFKEI
ncbi:MAG: GTPase HflX, partial [Methylococcales bacterium]|nr:GTPase HflX [Methylococcales bacterium]